MWSLHWSIQYLKISNVYCLITSKVLNSFIINNEKLKNEKNNK